MGRRKATRAPILTQVEAQAEHLTCLGRAHDISIGGVLIETPETLAENSCVIVRFSIPPRNTRIEAAGRVVRATSGKLMAIAFLGLPENHKQTILEYVRRFQEVAPADLPSAAGQGRPRLRRSGRIERRLPVLLSWLDPEGRTRHESAETQRLSKHGVQVLSFAELQPGWLVRVTVPEMAKEGQSHVVWTAAADVPGRVRLGLEFLGTDDFWGIPFPTDPAINELTTLDDRRRCARLPRRVDVAMNWVDGSGQARREAAHTRDLSQHGAQIASPVPLPVGQQLRLSVRELGQEVESRVVWVRPDESQGVTHLGIEFMQKKDFWGIAFPQAATPSHPSLLADQQTA